MKVTAYNIIKLFRDKGFQAYWAGGCVRDILLGIRPKDYDIVTSATPDEIENIMEKTVPIGKSFGVILAIKNDHHFEIASFRKEGEYKDGRRPESIEFCGAEQDAMRRDFTINGMFYDPIDDKVIDYVDGEKDLDARLIRFIGDPRKRIEEDHLRILRGVRFKVALDFQYHPETYQAIRVNAKLVTNVAAERIRDELNKMIMSPQAKQAFEDMEDLGILQEIIPELVRLKGLAQPYMYHQEGDVWDHSMQALTSLSEDAPLTVRWATLFHDIGKYDTFKLAERIRYDGHASRSGEVAGEIMRRLNFDKKSIDRVEWIIKHHMTMVSLVEMPVSRRRHWFLHPDFPELLEVMRADAMGTTPGDLSLYNKIVQLYKDDMEKMPVRPKILLTGKDVMAELELEPGKEVGIVLEELHNLQLGGKITTREEAKEWLKGRKKT